MALDLSWRGRISYVEALEAQRAQRDRRQRHEVPDALWLLEHDPVITVGRRAVADLPPEGWLRAQGFSLCATERGGLATCHEPGQLVGYLLIDASSLGPSRTVAAVEAGICRWLAGFGVRAGCRPGHPGVWVSDAGWWKIASIGLHFRAGFTLHGFALNLVNDLRGFSLITPCGITDGGVTSLARRVGSAPTPEQAASSLGESVGGAVSDALAAAAPAAIPTAIIGSFLDTEPAIP